MNKGALFAAIAFCLLGPSIAIAATTDWMGKNQLVAFIDANMVGGKAYPTEIECRDRRGVEFRMAYTPFSGDPPFYKWQWVYGKSRDINKIIARIPLIGEPQRKYKIVDKHSFRSRNGDMITCAVIYR